MISKEIEKLYKRLVVALSVIVPLAVAALFGVKIEGVDFSFLPFYYACINGATAVLLVGAFLAIKNGKRALHQRLIIICFGLSAAFLVMYIMYHMTSSPTIFGGEGAIKSVYYGLLISHIILSVVVIPLVLITLLRAMLGDFEKHRKIAKYAFPVWLYVAVSGVAVYLLISPYYA